MTVAVLVLSLLLALSSSAGGAAKLVGAAPMRADAARLGFSDTTYRAIGGLELAGATGLVVGLFMWPATIAAAAGVVALMVGAVVAHVRAADPAKQTAAPIVIGSVAFTTALLALIANT